MTNRFEIYVSCPQSYLHANPRRFDIELLAISADTPASEFGAKDGCLHCILKYIREIESYETFSSMIETIPQFMCRAYRLHRILEMLLTHSTDEDDFVKRALIANELIGKHGCLLLCTGYKTFEYCPKFARQDIIATHYEHMKILHNNREHHITKLLTEEFKLNEEQCRVFRCIPSYSRDAIERILAHNNMPIPLIRSIIIHPEYVNSEKIVCCRKCFLSMTRP